MHSSRIVLMLLAPVVAVAAEPTAQAIASMKVELMQTTKIAAVTELSMPSYEYKSDGDPETLEVVFLDMKKDGPSRVSEDGEVIFLYKASDRKQEALIDKAFEIRALRKLNAT